MTTTAIAAAIYLTLFIIALLTPVDSSKTEQPALSKPVPLVQTVSVVNGK